MAEENSMTDAVTIRPASSLTMLEKEMTRRRYQGGSLLKRGPVWVFRWREDTITDTGTKRRHRSKVIGTILDFPTWRAARNEVDALNLVREANQSAGKPRHLATFAQFAAQWRKMILSHHKFTTQKTEGSRIDNHLLPTLGPLRMRDIDALRLQALADDLSRSLEPKTVRNIFATLSMMWTSARAWAYVDAASDPFKAVKLPKLTQAERPHFDAATARRIIEASTEPHRTIYWLVWQTGIRRGEVCALRCGDIDFRDNIITVRQRVWAGNIDSPKSRKPRSFDISLRLAQRLKLYCDAKQPEQLVFTDAEGKMLDPDRIVQQHLQPLLKRLNIPRAGMHAFRHGNATWCDRNGVPMALRQERLGHADAETTMRYSHAAREDGQRLAQQLDDALWNFSTASPEAGEAGTGDIAKASCASSCSSLDRR